MNTKKTRERKKKFFARLQKIVTALMLCGCQYSICAAKSSGKNDVINNLKNVKTLYLGVIAIIGAIQAGRHISDFADAWSHRDGAEMKSAGMGIAAGLVMVFVSGILAFIGVS